MEISDNEPFDDEGPDYEDAEGAPRYPIPSKRFGAVEVPALVQNVDRAVQAFGRVPDLNHVSSVLSPQEASPLTAHRLWTPKDSRYRYI